MFSFDSLRKDACTSKGENTVHLCAQRITFGDSDDPTDLLKLLGQVGATKARRLDEEDQIVDHQISSMEDRLRSLAVQVKAQAAVLRQLAASA